MKKNLLPQFDKTRRTRLQVTWHSVSEVELRVSLIVSFTVQFTSVSTEQSEVLFAEARRENSKRRLGLDSPSDEIN